MLRLREPAACSTFPNSAHSHRLIALGLPCRFDTRLELTLLCQQLFIPLGHAFDSPAAGRQSYTLTVHSL
jgi:hypothetical protein